MTPSLGFLLFVCGILAIYTEFVWPGRIVGGLLGCGMTVAGGYYLWKSVPTGMGMAMLVLAGILFIVEAFWRVDLLAGVAGVPILVCGFCVLLPAGRRIPLLLAIPVSTGFGIVTVLLACAAKRARRNKWSDIRSNSRKAGAGSSAK